MIALGLCATASATPPIAGTQPAPRYEPLERWQVRATGNDRHLWLANIIRQRTEIRSLLFGRGIGDEFDRGRLIRGAVVDLTPLDDGVVVRLENNAFYYYELDSSTALRVLPDRSAPQALTGHEGHLFGLVRASVAGQLRGVEGPFPSTPSTQPFRQTEASHAIVINDLRDWYALTEVPFALPAESMPREGPRLLVIGDELWIFWLPMGEESARLRFARYDLESREWLGAGALGSGPGSISGFWANRVNRIPTVVIELAAGEGEEPEREIFRLLPAGDGEPTWRPISYSFSPLPEGVTGPFTTHQAFGFNQHLGLLVSTAEDEWFVRFGRESGEPLESTIKPREVFVRPQMAEKWHNSLQLLTLVVMLVVIGSLFAFRRDSMIKTVILPPQFALALSLQRLLAFLIDVLPFSLAAALLLNLDWQDALSQLAVWGLGADPEGGLPEPKVLTWWLLSVGGYAIYMTVTELVTGRSIGKLIAGTRVLGESGDRASVWQVLGRNGMRLLELAPQFWVLALLVIISRNKQRVGDIFARTVVVRRRPKLPPEMERILAGVGGPTEESESGQKPPDEENDDEEEAGEDEKSRPAAPADNWPTTEEDRRSGGTES